MLRKTICILAPIHDSHDIRIFQKEAVTLATNGYKIIMHMKNTHAVVGINIKIYETPAYSSRFLRFVRLPIIFFRALKDNANIYHLHNPDCLPLAFALRLLGKKVVYDIHEDFKNKIMIKHWIPKPFRKIISQFISTLEMVGARFFNATIVTELPVFKRLKGNITLLENAPISRGPLIWRARRASEIIKNENLFRIIYIGVISKERGILEMLKVLNMLNDSIPARMWLLGTFENSKIFRTAAMATGWEYVDYLGQQSAEIAYGYVIKSDVGMATIHDVGGHRHTSINKIFEYMLFGLPFIASDFPKWREMLNGVEAGYWVDPINCDQIYEHILKIASDKTLKERLGANGKEFIVNQFNWERESKKLLNIYKKL
ncbi:MAG: glycosyltransferase [Proteobacteria bacterium]|nr:glycosyltransferase [Pseudomonadota bacterium]